jgi:hypothetical protein
MLIFKATLARYAVVLPLLGACSNMVEVPSALKPVNEKFSFALSAKGVQIYDCRAAADGKIGWTFVAPEAELFDSQGVKAGKHYGGPTWEGNDGSKTVGSVKQRSDGATANDIPWLLLNANSTGAAGKMAAVTSIQRVRTVGGVAPAAGCSNTTLGATVRVPYTADYYYFN